jgi:molybdenum cofactor synthesis domain-containing protein
MSDGPRPVPRVLVGAVMHAKSRTLEELSKIVVEEVRAAKLQLVRSVTVKGEPQYIQQLVSNVSTDNEADAILLVGCTGFGPKDVTCEAIDSFVERRIEGFADEFRALLRGDLGYGPQAWLFRAAAGVYNQCVVLGMSARPADIRKAMQQLVVPVLSDAVELATGRLRPYQLRT